jgi:hypothetical protein
MNLPSLRIPETVARRLAEIDHALKLAPGHGVAETLLASAIENFMEGDHGLIVEGWDFDKGPKWASAKLAKLAARWKAEDATMHMIPH